MPDEERDDLRGLSKREIASFYRFTDHDPDSIIVLDEEGKARDPAEQIKLDRSEALNRASEAFQKTGSYYEFQKVLYPYLNDAAKRRLEKQYPNIKNEAKPLSD